ncbi:MAG: nucleoside transporter [Phycisphaerales bacterium]
MPELARFQGLIGLGVLVLLAWLISERRRLFDWRIVIGGIGLQIVLAAVLLRVPGPVEALEWLSRGVAGVIARADAGIAFVFSRELLQPDAPWGFVFAVRVLPIIIFFASLMSVLYFIGVMPRLVALLAWVLRRSLGVSGAEAMAMASNVFVGQTEAPLCVRPLLEKMTRAQLMTLMVGGFATIAGSVLAAYAMYLAPGVPDELGRLDPQVTAARAEWIKHLITASVMSAPAAFVMARIIVPETETPPDERVASISSDQTPANIFDAAAIGAADGLRLALNVAAMLIAFVSLLALVSWPLEALGTGLQPLHDWLQQRHIDRLNLQVILGWMLAPLAWTLGVPWRDCGFFGSLMGEKIIATEFIAYVHLAKDVNGADPMLTERSARIAAYALCGFANFASVGIQIGGLSALAPGKRRVFTQLAMRAMIGGAFASWMTACIAGLFL